MRHKMPEIQPKQQSSWGEWCHFCARAGGQPPLQRGMGAGRMAACWHVLSDFSKDIVVIFLKITKPCLLTSQDTSGLLKSKPSVACGWMVHLQLAQSGDLHRPYSEWRQGNKQIRYQLLLFCLLRYPRKELSKPDVGLQRANEMMQPGARVGWCNRIRVFLNMDLLQGFKISQNSNRTKDHGKAREFEQTGI